MRTSERRCVAIGKVPHRIAAHRKRLPSARLTVREHRAVVPAKHVFAHLAGALREHRFLGSVVQNRVELEPYGIRAVVGRELVDGFGFVETALAFRTTQLYRNRAVVLADAVREVRHQRDKETRGRNARVSQRETSARRWGNGEHHHNTRTDARFRGKEGQISPIMERAQQMGTHRKDSSAPAVGRARKYTFTALLAIAVPEEGTTAGVLTVW